MSEVWTSKLNLPSTNIPFCCITMQIITLQLAAQRFSGKSQKHPQQQQYTTLKTLPTWDIRLFFHWWITRKYPLSRWFPNFHVFHYTFTNETKSQMKVKLHGQTKNASNNQFKQLVWIQIESQKPATMKTKCFHNVISKKVMESVSKALLLWEITLLLLTTCLQLLVTCSWL